MNQHQRQLTLGVFLTRHGHHPGAWRQPESIHSGKPDFAHWLHMVKTAERGKFDTAFFADFVGQSGDSTKGIERRHAFLEFEPLTLAAALAAATSKIGWSPRSTPISISRTRSRAASPRSII